MEGRVGEAVWTWVTGDGDVRVVAGLGWSGSWVGRAVALLPRPPTCTTELVSATTCAKLTPNTVPPPASSAILVTFTLMSGASHGSLSNGSHSSLIIGSPDEGSWVDTPSVGSCRHWGRRRMVGSGQKW